MLAVQRVPLLDAYAMAMDGRITDGVSIIGLARAVRHLGYALTSEYTSSRYKMVYIPRNYV